MSNSKKCSNIIQIDIKIGKDMRSDQLRIITKMKINTKLKGKTNGSTVPIRNATKKYGDELKIIKMNIRIIKTCKDLQLI